MAIAGLTGMVPRANAAAGDSISFNMVHAAVAHLPAHHLSRPGHDL